MKKRIALVLSLVLTISLFTACGRRETSTKVRLNEVTHSVFYAPMYAALKLGFFEEEGLDV